MPKKTKALESTALESTPTDTLESTAPEHSELDSSTPTQNNAEQTDTPTPESDNAAPESNAEQESAPAPDQSTDTQNKDQSTDSSTDTENPDQGDTPTDQGDTQAPTDQGDTPTETPQTDTETAPETDQGEQTPDQAPTPTPPLLPDTSPELPNLTDDEKLEAFKQELDQAIKDNAGVIANTHYTLQGIAELLNISHDLFTFYRYHAESIKLSSEQFLALQANLKAITTYINQSLEQIASTYTSSLELFATTETLLDEARALALESKADLEKVNKVIEISKELEQTLEQIERAKLEIQAQLNLAQEMKDQIQALVPNILNQVRTTLLSDKEQYEREIAEQKDLALQAITQKLESFTLESSKLKAQLEQTQQALEQSAQKIAELESKLDTKATELEAKLVEKKSELATQLEQSAQAHQSELTAHKENLKQELQELIEQNGGSLPSPTPPTDEQGQAIIQAIEQAKTNALASIHTTATRAEAQALQSIETRSAEATQEALQEINDEKTLSLEALQNKLQQALESLQAQSPSRPSQGGNLADYELGLAL